MNKIALDIIITPCMQTESCTRAAAVISIEHHDMASLPFKEHYTSRCMKSLILPMSAHLSCGFFLRVEQIACPQEHKAGTQTCGLVKSSKLWVLS